MNTILLTAGVVAVMAAVIGGGLRAFQIELPVFTSRGVRVALGVLGIAFLVAAVMLREDNTGGVGSSQSSRAVDRAARGASQAARDASQTRYQRQVAATCNALRSLSKRNTFGTPQISQPELQSGRGLDSAHFDRDTVISGEREKFAAIIRRLRLLRSKPVPASLRDEAKVGRNRAISYVRELRAVVITFADTLPSSPTLQQINAAAAPLRDRKDKATARLEDALTQLADRDCSLSSTWPAGST